MDIFKYITYTDEKAQKKGKTYKNTFPEARFFQGGKCVNPLHLLNQKGTLFQAGENVGWMFQFDYLTLLHSKRPKLYTILVFLSAIRVKVRGQLLEKYEWN